MSRPALVTLVGALLAAGCGGGQAFSLSATDNDPAALARALRAERPAPAARAVAYLALTDGKLAAFALDERRLLWTVPAQVASRVVSCGSFIALREGDALVARDATDGRLLWSRPAPGLGGLAGDGDRAYPVEEDGGAWRMSAVDRAGRELWHSESAGRIGVPAARGGLLYLPFLEQWLNVLDGATGKLLVRLRQTDEAVSWVRATDSGVFFGGRSVIVLDDAAASGKRDPGRHLLFPAPVHAIFPNVLGYFDSYGAYGARDRVRLLWRAVRGPTTFEGGLVTLLATRALFGLDVASGTVLWAHLQPRHDIVAAEDAGEAIVFVSAEGELGALDRRTGQLTPLGQAGARVAGATIDGRLAASGEVDGRFAPGAAAATVDRDLAAIALDRDARLGAMKRFAVDALSRRPGRAAAQALLAILVDPTADADVVRASADALVAGRDPGGTAPLVEALAVHSDHVSGTQARGVDVIARALAARAPVPGAAAALVTHLEDPATPDAVRRDVAGALAALRDRDSVPALESFLLIHRCDARWLGSLTAVIEALDVLGEREALRHVAADDETAPPVAAAIRERLP